MTEDISSLRQRMRSGAPDAAPANEAPAKGLVARLFSRAPSWVRRHERFPCCVIAVLELNGKDMIIEGLVTEISQGGLLFRPASHFIFDRRGSHVIVRFADDALSGRIVNVKAHGYGVEFEEVVTPERVQDILERFGLTGQQSLQ